MFIDMYPFLSVTLFFVVNDKCKALAKKVKEIIDTKSSFADWLNNRNVTILKETNAFIYDTIERNNKNVRKKDTACENITG